MVLNPSRGNSRALFGDTLRRTMGRCPAASTQNLQQSTFLIAFRPDILGLGAWTNHIWAYMSVPPSHVQRAVREWRNGQMMRSCWEMRVP